VQRGRTILTLAVAAAFCVVVLTPSDDAFAEEAPVPEKLQAELIAKIAAYDRSFTARARDRAHVVIIDRPDDADSVRSATHLEAALHELPDVGGLPHDEAVVPWPGAAGIADLLRARHAAIVYFTPGFSADLGGIRAALDGIDVLSVAAIPDYVPQGVVLGFDVISGKPKLLVNLTQARKQHVAFMAEILKMAKVYE